MENANRVPRPEVTFSQYLDECGDLRVVQAMLGHQSLSTTDRYLRPANQVQLRQAMAGRRYGAAS